LSGALLATISRVVAINSPVFRQALHSQMQAAMQVAPLKVFENRPNLSPFRPDTRRRGDLFAFFVRKVVPLHGLE